MSQLTPRRRGRSALSAVVAALVATAVTAPHAVRAEPPASVQPSVALIDDAFLNEIRGWLNKPVTIISLQALNARYEHLTQDQVEALDQQWRKERELKVQPLIARTFGSPLSSYLLQIQAQAGGLYSELIVVDLKGLNVGQSSVTTDYWQGDEAKYQKTVPNGPDAVFIDEPEYHAGSGTTRAQVNLSIPDPVSGEVIGAATIEVNLNELARRRALAAKS